MGKNTNWGGDPHFSLYVTFHPEMSLAVFIEKKGAGPGVAAREAENRLTEYVRGR